MKQGFGWLHNLVTLVLVAPVLACAQVRVAVLPVSEQASAQLVSILDELQEITPVRKPRNADILLLTSRAVLPTACAQNKPIVLLDPGIPAESWPGKCHITRIIISASLSRQVEVLTLLLPGAARVGVLYSEESAPLLPGLREQLEQHKLLLVARQAQRPEHLSAALAELMTDADLLLALPDMTIFNAGNARQLLMTAYRKGKPIIGPDDHWVRAGSLASAYISSDALSSTLGTVLLTLSRGEHISSPILLPDSVLVNIHVAKAFDIAIPPELANSEGEGQ